MRAREGQSIAELALLLPLLVMILVGCLDVGRAFSVWMVVNNATREGARYASLMPYDAAGIEERTRLDVQAEGLTEPLTVTVEMPYGCVSGKSVGVTAEYSLPLLTSFLFGGNPLRIRATTWMMIMGGCE